MVKQTYQFALMQGRLLPRYKKRYQSFPVGYWQSEFYMAKEFGFDFIEWIVDHNDCNENPLLNDDVTSIRSVIECSHVNIRSICADYFMEAPLHGDSYKLSQKVLNKLIINANFLSISDIIIPCVDQSSLKSNDDITAFITNIQPCIRIAEEKNCYLNLETDLAPTRFLSLIESLNSPNIKINYDSGNSASLGFDIEEEFAAYSDYISVFHIKDRPLNNGSVCLGQGDVNFELLTKLLKQNRHIKKLTLQASRAENYIDDINGVNKQLCFIKSVLEDTRDQ